MRQAHRLEGSLVAHSEGLERVHLALALVRPLRLVEEQPPAVSAAQAMQPLERRWRRPARRRRRWCSWRPAQPPPCLQAAQERPEGPLALPAVTLSRGGVVGDAFGCRRY